MPGWLLHRIAELNPQLVTFHGSGFDLPVLGYAPAPLLRRELLLVVFASPFGAVLGAASMIAGATLPGACIGCEAA